jgi:predicted ester cyclase
MSDPTPLVTQVDNLFRSVFHGRAHDQLDQLLEPDFTFQYPFPGFSSGASGIREFSELFHAAIPGFEFDINDLFGTSDKVAIRWTLRGRHNGTFLGIAPTGRYVTLSAIGIYIGGRGGSIGAGWLEMDTLKMLQDMNVIPDSRTLLPGLRQT